ncbi:hypothetical protein PPACK8108_LOCUS20932 [Phakopsora pachyrhizi]|uniref:Uncharacterized protein n=1 Tax=Phakopsora pachyrhizi TaxID=170000 RepID=A0AAV0BIC8_PHAPC|nr:hypothetical protein PPACK8108_LOCUS20932 [Phakopsora pachyrhizi]
MPLNSKSAASCVIYPVREDQHAYNHSNSHSQRHPSHQADLLPLKEYQHISKRSQDGHRTVEEFIFNYKSRSLLEAEGIIQPSQPQTRVTEARSEPRQRQRPGSQQDDPQSWSGKRKDPPKKEDSDDDDFLLFDLSPRKQDKSGQQASSLNRSDEHHSKKNEQEKESYKEPRDEKPEPSCVTIYSSSSDEEETKDRTDPTNKKAKTDSKGDQKPRVSLGSSSCSNSLNDSKKPDSKDCLRDRNTIVVTAVKKEEGQGQRSEESSTANKGPFKDEEEVDRKGFKKYEEEVKEGLDEVKGSEAPKRKKRSIGRMIIDLTMTSSDSE